MFASKLFPRILLIALAFTLPVFGNGGSGGGNGITVLPNSRNTSNTIAQVSLDNYGSSGLSVNLPACDLATIVLNLPNQSSPAGVFTTRSSQWHITGEDLAGIYSGGNRQVQLKVILSNGAIYNITIELLSATAASVTARCAPDIGGGDR